MFDEFTDPNLYLAAAINTSIAFEVIGFLLALAELKYPEQTAKFIEYQKKELQLNMKLKTQMSFSQKSSKIFFFAMFLFGVVLGFFELNQIILTVIISSFLILIPAIIALLFKQHEKAVGIYGISLGITALICGEIAEYLLAH